MNSLQHGEDKHLKLVGTPAFMSPELILGIWGDFNIKIAFYGSDQLFLCRKYE